MSFLNLACLSPVVFCPRRVKAYASARPFPRVSYPNNSITPPSVSAILPVDYPEREPELHMLMSASVLCTLILPRHYDTCLCTFLLARPENLKELRFNKLPVSEENWTPERLTKKELLFLIRSLHDTEGEYVITPELCCSDCQILKVA